MTVEPVERQTEDESDDLIPWKSRSAFNSDGSRGLPSAGRLLKDILNHRGWDRRGGQVTMIKEIKYAIEDEYDITVNAPVGIGKSLAYLIAALPSNRRIIITTSTKALQDQLINDELPKLRQDLQDLYEYDLTYEVLKGKSNYLCMEKAKAILEGEMDEEEAELWKDLGEDISTVDMNPLKELISQVEERMRTAKEGKSGVTLDSGDELRIIDRKISSMVQAKRCTNHGGPWWVETEGDDEPVDEGEESFGKERVPLPYETIIEQRSCPQGLAYAKAMSADIVVMNTSLLSAELQKATAFEKALFLQSQIRASDLIVVDEAHHLTRIITDSMSVRFDLESATDNVKTLAKRISNKRADIKKEVEEIATSMVRDFQNTIPGIIEAGDDPFPDEEEQEKALQEEAYSRKPRTVRGKVARALWNIKGDYTRIYDLATSSTIRGGQPVPADMAKSIVNTLNKFSDDVVEPAINAAMSMTRRADFRKDINDPESETMNMNSFDLTFTPNEADTFVIDLVPIDLSFFRDMVTQVSHQDNIYMADVPGNSRIDRRPRERGNIIMCSGTITEEVGNIIGIRDDDYEYHSVPSPFPHEHSRICIPDDIPVPTRASRDDWVDAVMPMTIEAIRRCGGRTMVITTSQEMSDWFAAEIQSALPDLTLVWQGGGWTRAEMVDIFSNDEHSVLCGTKGFWEGVNVPGPALSQVIIDKIPFPMPNDPIVGARRRFIEMQGGNAFMRVDVDMAAIDLEQGRGRLIRSVDDIGGVLILDPRLANARYKDQALKLFDADILSTNDIKRYYEWIDWVNADNGHDQDYLPSSRGWNPIRRSGRSRR